MSSRIYQFHAAKNGDNYAVRGAFGGAVNQRVGDQVTTDGHYEMVSIGVRPISDGFEGAAVATPVDSGDRYVFDDGMTDAKPMSVDDYHGLLIEALTNGDHLRSVW